MFKISPETYKMLEKLYDLKLNLPVTSLEEFRNSSDKNNNDMLEVENG